MESTFGDYNIKLYVQSPQVELGYIIDECYFVDNTQLLPPLEGLIRDGDFESYQFGSDWFANGGSLEYIEAADAPSGTVYAKLTSRTASWNSISQIIPLDDSYIGTRLTTSFYVKIDLDAVPNWNPAKLSGTNAQIRIDFDQSADPTYLNCIFGCSYPDGEWQYMESNCDPIPTGLGSIVNARYYISGLADDTGNFLDYYIDNVKLDTFSRDRSWINAANLRIDDIRKVDLNIGMTNRADVAQVI